MSGASTIAAAERRIRLAGLSRHPAPALAALLLAIIVLAACLAPLLTPQDPYDLTQLDLIDGQLPPGSPAPFGIYALGTDPQGRDMYSAILYGLRTSLAVAAVSTGAALVVGILIGLLAAFAGGVVDDLVMRLVDLQLSFPAILIALILLAVLGPGVGKVMVAVMAVQWAYFARTVRATALVERQKDYVQAAFGLALGTLRVSLGHVLPNCLPPLLVIAPLQAAHAITLEATLSFLGVGVPVTEPSLGMLIAGGYEYLLSGEYWISLFPGLALVLLVGSINVISERLQSLNNPRRDR